MLRSLSTLIFLLAIAWPTFADDELDVTMEVIEDENVSEEMFVNEISLPSQAAEQAHENAAFGHETANQARQQGSEFGQQRAEEARENGGQGNRPEFETPGAGQAP